MSDQSFSDFSDGGRLPSGPISPVREVRSSFPEQAARVLRNGSRGKNYTSEIRFLCSKIPESAFDLKEEHLQPLLLMAGKCRASREMAKLLCVKPVRVRKAKTPRYQSRLYNVLRGGSRSKNFEKMIEDLCQVLPTERAAFTSEHVSAVLVLARKCRCAHSASRLLGCEKKPKVLSEKPKRVKLTDEQRREKKRIEKRRYKKHKRSTDVRYRILEALRRRLGHVLKGRKKSYRTLALLGCSLDHLKTHLESKWTDGMSWENYGIDGWHIDHVRPCASFDLAKREDQAECFRYTNLQPLWAKDNIAKGARY